MAATCYTNLYNAAATLLVHVSYMLYFILANIRECQQKIFVTLSRFRPLRGVRGGGGGSGSGGGVNLLKKKKIVMKIFF